MTLFRTVALALMLVQCGASSSLRERRLSQEPIAGYIPETQVTDHNAIDLDQKAMEDQLSLATDGSYTKAKAIYQEGAYSKSYAELSISDGLPGAVTKGSELIGTAVSGSQVKGWAMEPAESGATTLKFQYATSDIQDSYVDCQVGALGANGNTGGCLADSGTIQVEGFGNPVSYSYTINSDNKNARTLAGFSTGAQSKMAECDNCPYVDYQKFYDYYGEYDYADQWVLAAFNGGKTSFKNGNADFSGYGYDGKTEAIKKGTAYMNVWMYVIREMEDALDDCKEGCIDCNDDPVHAWDEAVAFYTGSEEGQDGSGSGYLIHALADKRCANFNTCGNGDSIEGGSKINADILREFKVGQQNLLAGKCGDAKAQKERIVQLMAVPLVQGTLRYAYLTDSSQSGVTEKAYAEGATFAASVLPVVNACNSGDAETIYNNMKVGSGAADFGAVKSAFENNYGCMGITCADVGGLYDDASLAYYEGADPCTFSGSNSMKVAKILSIGVSVGVATFLALFA